MKTICANRSKGNWHQLTHPCSTTHVDAHSILIQTIRKSGGNCINLDQNSFSYSSCQELNKTDHAKGIASVKYYVRRASFNYDPICKAKRQQDWQNRNSSNRYGNFMQRSLQICVNLVLAFHEEMEENGEAPHNFKKESNFQTIVPSCTARLKPEQIVWIRSLHFRSTYLAVLLVP